MPKLTPLSTSAACHVPADREGVRMRRCLNLDVTYFWGVAGKEMQLSYHDLG